MARRATDQDPAATQQAIREEARSSWPVFGSALMTRGQSRGGIAGVITLGLLGAVVGALLGLLPILGLDLVARVVIFGAIGLVAGGTAGAVIGGGMAPDLEGETGALPGEGPRTLGQQRSGHAD